MIKGEISLIKEEFNKLDIKEQIEYFNNSLENNVSITAVCKQIGIGRSTISDRFKKHNYSYCKELNQYTHREVPKEQIKPFNGQNNECNTTSDSIENTISEVINISSSDIKNNLLDIANNYNTIKEMIEIYRRDTRVIKQQIIIDITEAESIIKTFRVNKKIWEEFNYFCDKNKQFKKVDLLSQALKNFIKTYK